MFPSLHSQHKKERAKLAFIIQELQNVLTENNCAVYAQNDELSIVFIDNDGDQEVRSKFFFSESGLNRLNTNNIKSFFQLKTPKGQL